MLQSSAIAKSRNQTYPHTYQSVGLLNPNGTVIKPHVSQEAVEFAPDTIAKHAANRISLDIVVVVVIMTIDTRGAYIHSCREKRLYSKRDAINDAPGSDRSG